MQGINLGSLIGNLYRVSDTFVAEPVHSIQAVEAKLAWCKPYLESRFDTFTFSEDYRKLPLAALREFSFEDICKMKYSSIIRLDESVSALFDTEPHFEIVRKIMNSMWRWGLGRGTWNELVDVWCGLRSFELSLGPDFDIRLDYTTGYNPFGYSTHSQTFIDGVFAFLVYYKHVHVMTIGFSVTEGRRILIQQVQLRQRSQNRWLYQFPQNRMDFVIDLFIKHFPHFTLCVIDGEALVQKTIADYQKVLGRAQERLGRMLHNANSNIIHTDTQMEEYVDEVASLKKSIAHLQTDRSRLVSFYKQYGRHVPRRIVEINSIPHVELELKC